MEQIAVELVNTVTGQPTRASRLSRPMLAAQSSRRKIHYIKVPRLDPEQVVMDDESLPAARAERNGNRCVPDRCSRERHGFQNLPSGWV